jgi:hypothetical protein
MPDTPPLFSRGMGGWGVRDFGKSREGVPVLTCGHGYVEVAWHFSIKVRLIRKQFSIAIMIAMKFSKSRFGEKISSKVCRKLFNQSLVAKN